MAVAAAVHGSYIPSKFRRLPQITISLIKSPPPPLFISTNPNDVNLNHLKSLFAVCNHSCHRFPKLNSDGKVEPVDIHKLKIALVHSYVVVSVFTQPGFTPDLDTGRVSGVGGDWIRKVVPVTPGNGELVIPSLRRKGIGRKIVQRIIRILANREIYDIAALCSDQEKPFFRACGFGDDILASTTMMYTRSVSNHSEGEQMVKYAGRKVLLVPAVRGPSNIASSFIIK